ASVRVETPSLARMLDTWTLAILGEIDSSLAMTRLPRPAATSRSTSISPSARPNRDCIPGEGIFGWPVAGRATRAWRATQAIRHAELTRDLRNGKVGRQVAQDAGLGLAERRGGAARPRRARPREPAQDVGAQGGVRGALPGMALKQSRRRVDVGGEE